MDWSLVKEGLFLMLKGMAGIFVVMFVIYLSIIILSNITKKKDKQ